MSSCALIRPLRSSNGSPTRSRTPKRPHLPPLVLSSIDEEATPSEYDVGGLDLGAESPGSRGSTANILENTAAYVRQARIPYWNASRRTAKERHSKRDDDRDCGICFEYAVRPCRTLCCGKIFCTEHLSDWLHGPNAEGRCPNCENACTLSAGTLSLTPSALQSPVSPHAKRQTLWPSSYGGLHPNDARKYRATGSTSRTSPSSQSKSTTSSTSTGLSSNLATGWSSDDESVGQHYRHLRMKGGLHAQLGSASASAINLSTTPFSQSWGAISRLMSIITFLMFIYKLLS